MIRTLKISLCALAVLAVGAAAHAETSSFNPDSMQTFGPGHGGGGHGGGGHGGPGHGGPGWGGGGHGGGGPGWGGGPGHGGPGWGGGHPGGPGWGRPGPGPRPPYPPSNQRECFAQNNQGQNFVSWGYDADYIIQDNAINYCRANSYYPGSCVATGCRWR